MTTHYVKLARKPFFELLSGEKTAEIRHPETARGVGFRVGDTILFSLTDENGNPTPHEMSRVISHIEYPAELDGACLLSYAKAPMTSEAEDAKNASEHSAFLRWASEDILSGQQDAVDRARQGWLAALQWLSTAPGESESYALYRAATIVRRLKQHNTGARGIDSYLEKAAQGIEKRAEFERYFYSYLHPIPAKPQLVCMIGAEDAKFLQEQAGRVGTFRMNLYLDGDSAAQDTNLLYVLPSAPDFPPVAEICEYDKPKFEQAFPEGPDAEWQGWKACYEHHVIPMSAEIQRLKIHHRAHYLDAYLEIQNQGLGA